MPTSSMRELPGSSDEPDAVCEQCGAVGTIGRAARTDSDGHPTEIHRSCLRCWPEEMARYRARWTEEDRLAAEAWMRNPALQPQHPSRGMVFDALTWHTTLELVRDLQRGVYGPASEEELRKIAQDIVGYSRDFRGDIPMEVEMFLKEHLDGTV